MKSIACTLGYFSAFLLVAVSDAFSSLPVPLFFNHGANIKQSLIHSNQAGYLLQISGSQLPSTTTRKQQSSPLIKQQERIRHDFSSFLLWMSSTESSTESSSGDDNGSEEEEEEVVEPGKMRVTEIRAELEMRGISYSDCFDKESLAQRLKDARESGIANPNLIDKFNKQRLEDTFEGRKPVDEAMSNDDLINQAVGNDGNLPGGLSPDQFKGLIENPDVMTILQSSKMQECMKLVMAGDQQKVEQAMTSDPELRDMMGKLQSILGGGGAGAASGAGPGAGGPGAGSPSDGPGPGADDTFQ